MSAQTHQAHHISEDNDLLRLYDNKPVSIGIDLGSSLLRVGIYDSQDATEIAGTSTAVGYHQESSEESCWEYTQSPEDIILAIYKCFKQLDISSYNVFSCGVSATCSMVIVECEDSSRWCIGDEYSDAVVFWMDNSAIEETKFLNNICDNTILDTLGGSFIPEMGAPKLLKFINKVSNYYTDYVVLDLHRYIALKIMQEYGFAYKGFINKSNPNGVANDGECLGWSDKFYSDILKVPSNIDIGILEDYIPKVSSDITSVSCIDCYSSWFATFPYSKKNTLFIAAGTSSCYLYMKDKTNDKVSTLPNIKGIWGPFTGVIDENHPVYEAGSSCSGKLLEHLFNLHSASTQSMKDDILNIEDYVEFWESKHNKSYHWNIKHVFYYGDLDGNRTPFADPNMRGMFIGESSEASYEDLIDRYFACLEFLAFQSKLLITEFKKLGPVDQLIITGSQAENSRLLNLISLMNDDIRIQIPKENANLMGTKGAALMSIYAKNGKSIIDSLNNTLSDSNNDSFFEVNLGSNKFKTDDSKLRELLNAKFKINIDMAKQQKKYRELINIVTQASD
ncbi:hypothetical protein MOUN0_O13696 [Monosporozyma unispora]|nr:Ribulokinase-like protein [Kazachstania unispora]